MTPWLPRFACDSLAQEYAADASLYAVYMRTR